MKDSLRSDFATEFEIVCVCVVCVCVCVWLCVCVCVQLSATKLSYKKTNALLRILLIKT